jgi:radical SAM superfamily enzyme YgiQ (UPF0313 family)
MSYRLAQGVRRLLAEERGTVYKPHGDRLRFALGFPNSYRLAMSNLGYQLVYRLLNQREDTVCERFFLPDPADEAEYRRTRTPLFAWESGRPLAEFDILGFSVSFEMDYVNVLKQLELAGVPLLAKERGEADPVVVLGGPAPWVNPEAVAPFIDAAVIGEAEGLTDLLVPVLLEHRAPGGGWRDRHALGCALAEIQGVYVPALYEFDFEEGGPVRGVRTLADAPLPVRRWVARDLHRYDTSAQITTPNTEFGGMVLAEAARGCGQGCRFCFAGYAYRPVRYTPPEQLETELARHQAREAAVEGGDPAALRVGLVGSSLTDHKQISGITTSLARRTAGVSLASLRADNLSEEVACAIGEAGQKTVTLAPETGSERLRYVARKHVTDADVLTAARRCAGAGVEKLKLYYIVGLPCETEEDLLAIAGLSAGVQEAGRFRQVTLTLHPFVPKPHTAYQWAGTLPPAEVERRLKLVGRAVRRANSRLDFTVDSVRGSHVQAVLALADRRVAPALVEVLQNGGNWRAAFAATGVDTGWYACRRRELDEQLPWEHIHLGVRKDYLWREWQRALELDVETRSVEGWSFGAHGASPARPLAMAGGGEPVPRALEHAAWGSGTLG